MLFIPVASRFPEEMLYVEKSKNELFDMGLKDRNIFIYNCDKDFPVDIKFDCVYVCGGNTSTS